MQSGRTHTDHQLIYMDININKPKIKTNKIKIRPTASVTLEELSKHFNTDKIFESQSLSHAIDSFNIIFEHALEQIVPLKKVTSTRSNTYPYYNNDIKAQCHIMQRRERL